MAGDWIKLEHATLDKPEIGIAAEVLGISEAETFYLFMRYWVWLDQNLSDSCPGFVPFVSRRSLEIKFKCPGFAAVLEKIDWAKFDDRQQILTVTNWERHNGKSAKSRAVEQKKKAAQRAAASRSCPDDDGTKTGLEKRRVIKEEALTNNKDWKANRNGKPLPALWWKTDSGILAAALAIGMQPLPGQNYEALKNRIFEHQKQHREAS